MGKIAIFAGLGSDALFSKATRDRALADARSPHGKVLIEGCYKTFVEQVSRAADEDIDNIEVDLDDFSSPRDLIEPCHRYHSNPVVQNATLCLVQCLRYLVLEDFTCQEEESSTTAAGGFCVGLLAAVASACSASASQFVARAEECFRVAILVGKASWSMRRAVTNLPSQLPWSLVIANIGRDDMTQILSSQEQQNGDQPIFVSATVSANCVTLSGPGRALQKFVKTALPEKCNVRPTNIYSLYHNQRHGHANVKGIRAIMRSDKVSFPSNTDLLVPIINTTDGSLLDANGSDSDGRDLLEQILGMILGKPTDWIAVQETVISLLNKDGDSVWNFGPGYGALTGSGYADEDIDVRDVSQATRTAVARPEDIAIVGVGIDLPGASNLDTLWHNIMHGVNTCSEIPADRFHIEDYYVGDDSKPVNESRKMNTKFGNFLDDPFHFDNEFFGISPREASSMDPQQRLMLQTVHRALESAGYVADSSPSFSRETFGCFVGSATLDYTDNLRDNIDVYYAPGTLRAFISGRISYAFKWSGPSVTIDTACSSSVTALYQAAQALIAGDCRAAVAGGVNVMTSPEMYLGLDKAHFLSATGQCKAFDEAADGYCRGEGCASFVLKRLSDAISEKDRILGVIKGVALNQSGMASSITHPNAPTQESLFRSLLAKTGVEAHDVTVIEAHGTGTQAGDPNEFKSICGVFAQGRQHDNKLDVTSIKGNIGHLEAASGGAGLAKLLLMMQHKKIPPQASLATLSPAIENLMTDCTRISTESREWTSHGKPRTALLNNFGAAGSNGALILQEYRNPVIAQVTSERPAYTFGCSARTEALLETTRDRMLKFLNETGSDVRLADVCYTSTARRKSNEYRISTTASTIQELISKLEKAPIIQTSNAEQPIVFLFSGQGSQYAGMGKGLLELFPCFRKCVVQCNQRLLDWGYSGCLDVIAANGHTAFDTRSPENIQALQCAVFVLEVALSRTLIELGLKPSLVAGHSLGELAALVVAEVLDLESGLWLVAERARLIIDKCRLFTTSMLAVNMPASEISEKILTRSEFSSLTIACENSPGDCVVGGKVALIEILEQYLLEHTDKKFVRLDVPIAYHTPALDPVLTPLSEAAAALDFSTPAIPVASNVLGRIIEPGEDVIGCEYIAQHCRETVSFDSSIDYAYQHFESFEGLKWIEIGPHPMLLPMIAKYGATDLHSTLRKDKPADLSIAELFSFLYRSDDGNIAWRKLFEALPSRPRMIDIPLSLLDQKRFLVPFKRECATTAASRESIELSPFSFLQRQMPAGPQGELFFETPVVALASAIQGHVVCGTALCPASVYTEMALAAIVTAQPAGAETVYKIAAIRFLRPLTLTEASEDVIRISLSANNDSEASTHFEIASHNMATDHSQVHCIGTIKKHKKPQSRAKLAATEKSLSRRQTTVQSGEHQVFKTATMYDKIFNRVVEYGPAYRAVKTIYLAEQADEAFANCILPQTKDKYAGQPILLDTMLHVAGFAANLQVDSDTVCICHQVHSVTLLHTGFVEGQKFDVYCSNFTDSDSPDCILADAHATDERGVVAIIKGMEFKKVKLRQMQTALATASHNSSSTYKKANRDSEGRTRHKEAFSSTTPAQSSSSRASSTCGTSSRATFRSNTTSQDTVATILSEATGVDPNKIEARTSLSAMGVDSIMMFELDRKLEEVIGQKPNVSELSACRTVGDVEALVSRSVSRGATPVSSCSRQPSKAATSSHGIASQDSDGNHDLVGGLTRKAVSRAISTSRARTSSDPESALTDSMLALLQRRLGSIESPHQIQSHSDTLPAAPIYLIHPGAGICLHYNRMESIGRDVYTIQDGRLLANLEDDWSSIEHVAQAYATMIGKHANEHGHQQTILGGWSFGGIIAFEAARILMRRRDLSVSGVVLLDPPQPAGHRPIARETIEVAMEATLKASKPRSKEAADFEAAVGALTIRNNLRRASLLSRYRPSRRGPLPKIILLRSSQGLDLGVEGLPQNEWLHDRSDPSICTRAWGELIGAPIDVLDIPGDHFTPFEKENIEGTTEAIRRACQMLQSRT